MEDVKQNAVVENISLLERGNVKDAGLAVNTAEVETDVFCARKVTICITIEGARDRVERDTMLKKVQEDVDHASPNVQHVMEGFMTNVRLVIASMF